MRVNEIFYSIQGEGRYTGISPTKTSPKRRSCVKSPISLPITS